LPATSALASGGSKPTAVTVAASCCPRSRRPTRAICSWNTLALAEANRRGQTPDGEGLYWIEEPVRHDDYVGCARVASALATPVQIGENCAGALAMATAIAGGACHYVMPTSNGLAASRVGSVPQQSRRPPESRCRRTSSRRLACICWPLPRLAIGWSMSIGRRAPAMSEFSSQDEARQWVINEAAAVRVAVEWITEGTARERVGHRAGARYCVTAQKSSADRFSVAVRRDAAFSDRLFHDLHFCRCNWQFSDLLMRPSTAHIPAATESDVGDHLQGLSVSGLSDISIELQR
jgi:hypothetical protein